MKTTTQTRTTELKRDEPTPNGYALPDGTIIKAPEHMRDAVEMFTMKDRSVVYAVRVIDREEAPAVRMARQLEQLRVSAHQ